MSIINDDDGNGVGAARGGNVCLVPANICGVVDKQWAPKSRCRVVIDEEICKNCNTLKTPTLLKSREHTSSENQPSVSFLCVSMNERRNAENRRNVAGAALV